MVLAQVTSRKRRRNHICNACLGILLASRLNSAQTAQSISVGIIAGVSPGGGDYSPFAYLGSSTHTTGYPGGLSLELGIGRNWSIELDGMDSQLLHTGGFSKATTFQVPVLAKYRFKSRLVEPFLEVGPSFRKTGGDSSYPPHFGATAGAGVALHFGRFSLEPTVRLTHWGQNRYHYYSEAPNRVEFLLGVNTVAAKVVNWRPLGSYLSIGTVVGTSVTGDFTSYKLMANLPNNQSTYVEESGPRSFLGGAMVELHVIEHFYVEADGFYRNLHQSSYNTVYAPSAYTSSLTTWQFPVMAKYKFGSRSWRPLVELGPNFRAHLARPPIGRLGIAAGGGVEGHWGPFTISPRIRYSHWSPATPGRGSNPRRDEIVILTGFALWGGRK